MGLLPVLRTEILLFSFYVVNMFALCGADNNSLSEHTTSVPWLQLRIILIIDQPADEFSQLLLGL